LVSAVALLFSSCAADRTLFLSSGPTPRVEDCMILQQSTPTKFVCNGKTYTSVQLSDIRLGKGADKKTQ